MTVEERFLKYVSYDTQSMDDQERFPSTQKQEVLLKELKDELTALGLDVIQDENKYVYAKLPSNIDGYKGKKLCFISHVDTSPAVSGANVKAKTVLYKGGDVVLNEETGMRLTLDENPDLNDYIGNRLIVTDGTTLLGADDKAGVAEIMQAVEYLVNHPEIKHGDLRVAFTPDEEVGRGVDFFNVKLFDADFGYTIDGGKLGEIEYENFHAAAAVLKIHGTSIHPGSAKGIMKNAIDMFCEFHAQLPESQRPVNTENYEGFYMVNDVSGDVENFTAKYIIRDHDMQKFGQKKEHFVQVAEKLNEKYGAGVFETIIKDSYYNMSEIIKKNMFLIDNAVKAMNAAGVKENIVPIRGGTDGARLSFMGLPCPNLSTGGHNFHGRKEYVPIESMEKMVQVILNLVDIYSKD